LPPPQWPPQAPLAPPISAGSWDSGYRPKFTPQDNDPGMNSIYQKSATYLTNSNNGAEHQDQTITNLDYVFKHPYYDAKAQYERAQISLIDQQFAAFMYAQYLQLDDNGRVRLETVFANELASIDADVYRHQIAYLNTILMSPIPGVVTGVYKNPGETVKAGEPVIRVENYSVILLEATLIFRGLISIGQAVTVTTALFDASSGQPTSISGVVVAVRGRSDDDQWHVIIECDNIDHSTTPPKPILPLGYHFDFDDTTVTVG
jgi:biotin carboxyl carrier protein